MKRLHRVGCRHVVLAGALVLIACGNQAGTPTGGTGGLSGLGRGGTGGFGATGGTAGTGLTGVAGSTSLGGTGGSPKSGAGGTAGSTPNTGGMGGSGGMSMSTGGSGGAAAVPPKKFCGNITTGGQVPSDFATYWDQITPENEGKWGSVERVRDQMNWTGLDAAYNYAKQHNIPFKQHNFVWGSQQPNWMATLPAADQRAQVEEWIRLYCERYPDTQMIDVVNEPPPHTMPSYAAALGGAGASGYDWIVQSFKWARQYCPKSILILNDYNTIENQGDNSHFIDIVTRIKAAGAPIDAIGAQAHGAYNMSTSDVQMYIDKLGATGLPIYISEYDINLADDTKQKNVMESQITMMWNDDHIKGITLWGYVQGRTWLPNTGLMSSTGQLRPAMTWLMGFLKR